MVFKVKQKEIYLIDGIYTLFNLKIIKLYLLMDMRPSMILLDHIKHNNLRNRLDYTTQLQSW